MKKLIIIFALVFFFTKPAYAYLDPGTGSYILQIIGAAIFGSLFALKVWWKQITGFFIKIFKRKDRV